MSMALLDLREFTTEPYCYLTTTGRVSGREHTIEIWFALHDKTLYLLSGGRTNTDWVKNLLKNPHVVVRLRQQLFHGVARLIEDLEEDGLARQRVVAKYQPGYSEDLSEWKVTALPIGIDIVSGS